MSSFGARQQSHTWKDHDFPVLTAAVDVWVDEANKSVIEMTELKNKSTLSVMPNDSDSTKSLLSPSVTTSTSSTPKVKTTKRKKSAMTKVISAKPTDRCSTPSHKPINVTAPPLSCWQSIKTSDELSQTSNMEYSVINATEDMPLQLEERQSCNMYSA